MSDVVDVKNFTSNLKTVKDLREYSDILFNKLAHAQEVIEQQKKEIMVLKESLKNQPISLSSDSFDMPPEMLICEMELARFKQISSERELSLEEAKKFDIYTKNILAIRRARAELKQDKDDVIKVEKINTDDLLSVVDNEQSTENK